MPSSGPAGSRPNISRASVDVQGDRLVKSQPPGQSRIERGRTELGAKIAAECDLFDVPEILSHDDAKGEIVFRHLPDAVPLREHLSRRPDPHLMGRVGRALAAIHNAHPSPCGSEVFWHGDYDMRNVLYSESKDRITVIDWSNANWVLEPAEKSNGSPGMDLGVALISLFHQRPFGFMYISKTETLGAAFLQGYQRELGCFRIETVLPFISGLIRLRREYWISQRGFLRNLFHDPSLIRLRLFLFRIQPRLQ